MRNNYLNPFQGKQKRLDVHGLFLLSPEVLLKLFGFPLSKIYAEMGMTPLFKSIEHIKAGRRLPSQKIFNKLFDEFPAAEGEEFKRSIDEALLGDLDSCMHIVSSPWRMTAIGSQYHHGELFYHLSYMSAVEAAFAPGVSLWMTGDREQATQLFLAEPLLAPFFWPEAADVCLTSNTENELAIARYSLVLEIALSLFAAVEVQSGKGNSNMIFLKLIPALTEKQNSVTCFVALLKEELKVNTLTELLNHPALQTLELDESTVKRWSSGKVIPNKNIILAIAKSLSADEEQGALHAMYAGMIYMNFLGYYWNKLGDTRAEKNLFPHQHSTFESWVTQRYPVWYSFHLARYKAGLFDKPGTQA